MKKTIDYCAQENQMMKALFIKGIVKEMMMMAMVNIMKMDRVVLIPIEITLGIGH